MMISRVRVANCIAIIASTFTIMAISACGILAAEQNEINSANNEQLARALKRYPEADANGDGVLTWQEAVTYRDTYLKPNKQPKDRNADSESTKSDRITSYEPTFSDVRYGDHPRNLLDFYQADSDKPTPVLIYFHGGGFVSGDKGKAGSLKLVRDCLDAGISVVSGNYRFVRERPGEPAGAFPLPTLDAARVVQYTRHNADKWNIDPERIAMAGGSAGGCISCWIATHDDLADPDSKDPIARESTRLSCVIGYGAQTTTDPHIILKEIGGNPGIHPSLLPGYGVEERAELETPRVRKIIEEASSLNHVSEDDPPMQLHYNGPIDDVPLSEDTSIGRSIHHPMFGKLMQDRYKEIGLECEVICTGLPAKETEIEFLKRIFKMK